MHTGQTLADLKITQHIWQVARGVENPLDQSRRAIGVVHDQIRMPGQPEKPVWGIGNGGTMSAAMRMFADESRDFRDALTQGDSGGWIVPGDPSRGFDQIAAGGRRQPPAKTDSCCVA